MTPRADEASRPPWQQHTIFFRDRDDARHAIVDRLAPALNDAQDSGQLRGWWYMNKQPWPLRYRADEPAPLVETVLDDLLDTGAAEFCASGVYEPETDTFGGPAATDAAHELFHHDSRHLLTYQPGPGHLGRRETAVLLVSAMMRGAGLDWFEQGDVWSKVSEFRPLTEPLTTERSAVLVPSVRTLMTSDGPSLCHPDRPLHGCGGWVGAFTDIGAALACLAVRGSLIRGLRAVLAHHVIFHFNRAGLSNRDQSILSATAREVVMGTPDTTSPDEEPGQPPTVPPVTNQTSEITTTGDPEAERLRHALVDRLQALGHARTEPVEQALRTMPRHLFVPDTPLAQAYANTPVNIKHDLDGASISCASQPGVVAAMLDQLDVTPGDRVLELGAGTGYNAALLAYLAGEHGRVVTLDVDDDLVGGARAHLTAAGVTTGGPGDGGGNGFGAVEVVIRDGALGYREAAPYDRIVATVGAHGVPHAWLDQLAPGGRLLVPQRLAGTVCRSVAYERRAGRWVSVNSAMNTFMPLRKGMADDDRRIVPLSEDGTVWLQAPAEQPLDVEALTGVLHRPRIQRWTGVTVESMESPEWMELFVACSVPSGLIRMLFPSGARGDLLVEDPYPSSTAAVAGGALTYLARRPHVRTTPEGGKLWEFGVIGHGPGSDDLAATVADAVRAWDRDYRSREASFEILPLDAPAPRKRPGLAVLDSPLNRIVVDWNQ